jgi:hypothetical protein
MTHLDIWNISYGQKKGHESNWQFDSRSLKVKNHPGFLACMSRATYHWKSLNKGYNFSLDLISILGLHAKLWACKVARVPVVKIFGTLTWESRNKNVIWMWDSWRGTKYTIKGKVVGSPKSRLCWILWVRVCPWLVLAPKLLQLCTNQLVA